MDHLKSCFEHAMERLGLTELPCDVADRAPWGLRFRIGGDEDIYLGDHRKPNGAYIENGVRRAMELYARLPEAPDILRIDQCPGLTIAGLKKPDLSAGNSDYWHISGEPVFLRKLFREIIKAEIDPTGVESLASGVYCLCSREGVVFHLYDDRGADVAAGNREILRPLYEAFRQWIPEDRREQADQEFGRQAAEASPGQRDRENTEGTGCL